jgi:hypothetical protein
MDSIKCSAIERGVFVVTIYPWVTAWVHPDESTETWLHHYLDSVTPAGTGAGDGSSSRRKRQRQETAAVVRCGDNGSHQ